MSITQYGPDIWTVPNSAGSPFGVSRRADGAVVSVTQDGVLVLDHIPFRATAVYAPQPGGTFELSESHIDYRLGGPGPVPVRSMNLLGDMLQAALDAVLAAVPSAFGAPATDDPQVLNMEAELPAKEAAITAAAAVVSRKSEALERARARHQAAEDALKDLEMEADHLSQEIKDRRAELRTAGARA